MSNEFNQQRRIFLTRSATAGVIACSASLTPFLQSCVTLLVPNSDLPLQDGEPIINLKTEKSLQEIGGAVKLRFAKVNDGSVILVIRTSQTEFTTYAAQCMHWGAEVGYPKDGIIECPLHGSRYKTTNGSVVNGPASKPLTTFKTTFDETRQQVIITDNSQ